MMQEPRPASVAALTERTEAPQDPRTTIRKIALAGACALAALAASNANATVAPPATTFQWTSTFTDSGPGPGRTGNSIAFTGLFSDGNNVSLNTATSETSNTYTSSLSGLGILPGTYT